MYINAYKETYDNLYLTKGEDGLSMISLEIERILDDDEICETAHEFLPKLKEIKQLAEQYSSTRDVASFLKKLKGNVHLETNDFKFLIESTPNNHVWVSVEYDHDIDDYLVYVTYTSVIEHIDDID